ncbi:MAG: acyl-CoA dehydrogenase family protein [Planctomycetaceae bacterium]
MNAFFQDQHDELRDRARQFVEREILPHIDEWDRDETPPFHLVPQAAELGLLGPHFPTPYGGGGRDVVSTCIVAEELGRAGGGVMTPFLGSSVIATGPVFHFGTEQQKQEYLRPVLEGKKIAAIAMTEPDVGSDVGSIRTKAVKDGGDYLITGEKLFITNGTRADFVLVAARTGTTEDRHRGLSLLLVDRGTPGFAVKRKLNKLGWHASDTAELTFESCRVPAHKLVGEVGRGFYHLMHNLDVERMVVTADALGLADSAYRDAAAFAKRRVQFGEPIVRNQVIRHMLVDMHVSLEAARLMTYNSAFAIDRGESTATAASSAKYFVTETLRKVTADAVQIMGGQGFLMDNAVQRYFRDAPVYTIGGGTSQIQKEIIAKNLGL